MKPIQIISQDLFDKIRSRFSNLEMGDETGAVTIDPAEAIFFDFDFVVEGNNLGRVSMSLADLGSLKVYYSQGITETHDAPVKKQWFNFLKEMRFFAMRRLLRFDTRDIAKTNLDKNDFQHLAATQPPKEQETMNENKKNKTGVAEAGYGRNRGYNPGFADPNAPKLGGRAYHGQGAADDESNILYIYKDGRLKQKMVSNRNERQARAEGFRDTQDEALKVHGIIRSKFDPKKFIQNQGGKWVQVFPYGEDQGVAEGLQEGRWNNKSTKKTSRAVRGQTEVIVRHHEDMSEMYPGARSQPKKIKSIFVQNRDGERWKCPFNYPALGFAIAQHVDNGGVPHDPAGKAITQMAEEIHKLNDFHRKIRRASLHPDASGITERALGRLNQLKTQMECLGKRQHYQNWMSSFQEPGVNSISTLDDVTMEEYKQKFTQSSFQEELSEFFPLLHKIMSEENTIDLEDYVREVDDSDDDDINETVKSPDAAFAEWAESVERSELTPDQISELKQALSQLPNNQLQLGNEGQTAIEFFADLVELHPELVEKFREQAGINPEADPIADVLVPWATENYPNLLTALGLVNNPQPDQPVAEGPGRMINGKEIDMRSLEIDGVDPRDYPDFSDAYISYALFTDGSELSDEEMDQLNDEHGDLVHELAYDSLHENEEQGGMPNKTMPTREAVVKEVAKLVKSRFNEDNPDVGPFNGAPNIALDVKKKCAEMFGDEVGEQAEGLALQFMEKLSQKWEAQHGPVQDDGLSRLKELLNNVKAKVEGIGDRGNSTQDFNKNIMPAEEGILSKAKEFGKKVLDKVAPGDDELLKRLEKDTGGKRPNMYNKPEQKENVELESIMKLAGIKEGDGPKKISKKEVDTFQKKHDAKLTGREVNRQEQDKNKKK
jgi:hypothetical protein